MRKFFTIYEEAVTLVTYDFAPDPSEFPYIYEENFIFFFYQSGIFPSVHLLYTYKLLTLTSHLNEDYIPNNLLEYKLSNKTAALFCIQNWIQ
jgi:hypothetical protein